MAASVVDLPLPVVPVTSMSPRSHSAISASTMGRLSSSNDGTVVLSRRITMPSVPRWWCTLTRKRAGPSGAYEKSMVSPASTCRR